MKYTREQRLDIGRQVYEGELSRYEAAAKYEISEQSARSYMREYRAVNGLPPKASGRPVTSTRSQSEPQKTGTNPDLSEYEAMTKEELIRELVRSNIREARLKKGYEVKGDGREKVFIPLNNKNTK